jgi:general nucleoside transport system ATP-binding protein
VSSPALELSGISKRYRAAVALTDASFTLRPGTVHALLGENGAGKTTLMRVAFGMVQPDAGQIRIDGKPVDLRSPAAAIAAGVGMVHQHFTLVPAMTVAENVALGGHGLVHRRESADRVRAITSVTGFELDPDALVERLSVGAQQRVEIAKALTREARILVLDEPTAVLAPAEVEELLAWLRRYVADGHAAVIITHKLREALSVADDVTVLRHGRVVHTGSVARTSGEALTAAMLGADEVSVPTIAPVPPPTFVSSHGPVVFRAEALSVCDEDGVERVRDATFVVRGGEIVGVVGVEDAGQRELLRALAGRRDAAGGTVTRPASVGFIPDDRHQDAVLLDRSLVENVALRGAGARRGTMAWPAFRTRTDALLRAYDVRGPGAGAPMRALSGGNQQKLVLARELDAADQPIEEPLAIVAENPMRGLDVRAAAEVAARLRDARDRGAAVIVYSSDLDEVLSLASRVLVVYAGTVREVPTARDVVGRAMLGLD